MQKSEDDTQNRKLLNLFGAEILASQQSNFDFCRAKKQGEKLLQR